MIEEENHHDFFKPHGYFLLTSLSLQKDKKNQNVAF
jgi:hypothetical protein